MDYPDLLDALARVLDTAGVINYPASDASVVLGRPLQETPIQAVSLNVYGAAPRSAGPAEPMVQLYLRDPAPGGDARPLLRRAMAAFEALIAVEGSVLTTSDGHQVPVVAIVGVQGGPVPLGLDEAGHPTCAVNVRALLRN